jgi:hypothetical protein
MCHYLNEARVYHFAFETGLGRATVAQSVSAYIAGGSPAAHSNEEVKRAFFLLQQHGVLSDAVAQFRNRLTKEAGL